MTGYNTIFVPDGDYNNGTVNAADYVVWRIAMSSYPNSTGGQFGPTVSPGASPAPQPSTSGVPETATYIGCLMFFSCYLDGGPHWLGRCVSWRLGRPSSHRLRGGFTCGFGGFIFTSASPLKYNGRAESFVTAQDMTYVRLLHQEIM